MNAVYVLGAGSRHDNLELRCSLRSLERFVTGIDQVIVVGHRPNWMTGVEFIPWPDRYPCKERNIMDKILQACRAMGSGEFLQVHDDYFALSYQVAAEVPNWSDGDLSAIAPKAFSAVYRRSLENTLNALALAGLPTYHFDVHTPIRYDAAKFPDIVGGYDWEIRAGYTVKSLYANTAKLDFVHLTDLKLRKPGPLRVVVEQLRGRPWWSVGDQALAGNEIRDLLLALYPKKSRFEIL